MPECQNARMPLRTTGILGRLRFVLCDEVRTPNGAADNSVASATLRAPLALRADQRKQNDGHSYTNPDRLSLAVFIDRPPAQGAQINSALMVYISTKSVKRNIGVV